VMHCVCDEAGTALFTEADVAALARKSAPAISRVFHMIERLSGVTAASTSDLEKN
jgi:hypothetical protein